MTGWNHPTSTRRRVRVAQSTLNRIAWQEQALTQKYGQARTPTQRLSVVSHALMAAAAPGQHQPDQNQADNTINRVIETMRSALHALHATQRAAAETTLRTEERRLSRAAATPQRAAS